jgi:hypothetical protein
MGRLYTVEFGPTAVTTAVDFFEIAPADDKPCLVHAIDIGQTTELGDAQEEQLEWSIRRGGTAYTSGSGGSSKTPVLLGSDDAAAGFTAEVLNTTVATFTAGVIFHHSAFNVRTGLLWVPTPELRPRVSQANGGLVVRCEATPADSITFVGTLYVEEL